MKKAIKVFGFLILASVALTSCKKYDNGGSIRKAEKNIKKSWNIQSY